MAAVPCAKITFCWLNFDSVYAGLDYHEHCLSKSVTMKYMPVPCAGIWAGLASPWGIIPFSGMKYTRGLFSGHLPGCCFDNISPSMSVPRNEGITLDHAVSCLSLPLFWLLSLYHFNRNLILCNLSDDFGSTHWPLDQHGDERAIGDCVLAKIYWSVCETEA